MTCRSPMCFTMPVSIDVDRSTIRPETDEGDSFFGLAPGTNGTAAAARREVIEFQTSSALTWERHDGRPALGLLLVPTNRSDKYGANPWSGNF